MSIQFPGCKLPIAGMEVLVLRIVMRAGVSDEVCQSFVDALKSLLAVAEARQVVKYEGWRDTRMPVSLRLGDATHLSDKTQFIGAFSGSCRLCQFGIQFVLVHLTTPMPRGVEFGT